MWNTAASILLFFCFFALTEQRLLITGNEMASQVESDSNSRTDKVTPIIVKKVLAGLVTSEYNRVAPANQQLYIQSRAPTLACKEKYMTSCRITVYLVKTTCSRFTSNDNCKPVAMNADFKRCTVMVNLLTARVFSSLRCRNEGEHNLPEEVGDTSYFLKQSQEDYDVDAWNEDANDKMSKKQWTVYDGNPFQL